MKNQSIHEPQAKLMSAADVWQDAQTLREVLRHNLPKVEPIVKLSVPFSFFLSALEDFSPDELVMVRQRVEERLAA